MANPRPPQYHIARQRHLGGQLDRLEALGELRWRWSYDNRSAVYEIEVKGEDHATKYNTLSAEKLVSRICDRLRIIWVPVPHPGGEDQLKEALRQIEELKQALR